MILEEILRDLHMNARTVTGLAVGIDRATMPDSLQRGDGGFDHLAARLAVEGGNDAHTTGIMLLARIIESVGGEMSGIAAVRLGEVFAHGINPATGLTAMYRSIAFIA